MAHYVASYRKPGDLCASAQIFNSEKKAVDWLNSNTLKTATRKRKQKTSLSIKLKLQSVVKSLQIPRNNKQAITEHTLLRITAMSERIAIYKGNNYMGEGFIPQSILDRAAQIQQDDAEIEVSFSAFSKKADGSYSEEEFYDPNFETTTVHFRMDIPIEFPEPPQPEPVWGDLTPNDYGWYEEEDFLIFYYVLEKTDTAIKVRFEKVKRNPRNPYQESIRILDIKIA